MSHVRPARSLARTALLARKSVGRAQRAKSQTRGRRRVPSQVVTWTWTMTWRCFKRYRLLNSDGRLLSLHSRVYDNLGVKCSALAGVRYSANGKSCQLCLPGYIRVNPPPSVHTPAASINYAECYVCGIVENICTHMSRMKSKQ